LGGNFTDLSGSAAGHILRTSIRCFVLSFLTAWNCNARDSSHRGRTTPNAATRPPAQRHVVESSVDSTKNETSMKPQLVPDQLGEPEEIVFRANRTYCGPEHDAVAAEPWQSDPLSSTKLCRVGFATHIAVQIATVDPCLAASAALSALAALAAAFAARSASLSLIAA
jgi:hypothetical protein